MANSVRFRTRKFDGKETIRHNDGEKECYVYVHRLAMYAWTDGLELEDIWTVPPEDRTPDPRTQKMHVHHDIPIGWLNCEWNLSWHHPEEHGRMEYERRKKDERGRFVRA